MIVVECKHDKRGYGGGRLDKKCYPSVASVLLSSSKLLACKVCMKSREHSLTFLQFYNSTKSNFINSVSASVTVSGRSCSFKSET